MLSALRLVALQRRTANGTKPAVVQSPSEEWGVWLTVIEAASEVGTADR